MRLCADLLVLPLAFFTGTIPIGGAGHTEKRVYVCAEPNPQAICNPSNTCGSLNEPCVIDVKRTASSASAVPSIAGAKSNAPFCVAAGTTITWQSTNKNTGFTIDFGPSSPFESSGAIIGGSDRSVSLPAKKQGCYKFSVGACNTDAIYGMCAEGSAELIISAPTR